MARRERRPEMPHRTPMPPNLMIEQPASTHFPSCSGNAASAPIKQQTQQPQHANGFKVIREGGCLCGAARFSVEGRPLRIVICHCQDCRRASGSAFTFFAVWPLAAYQGTGELGNFEGRSFCKQCGSRVANLRSDEAEVLVGCLDKAPTDLIPEYELWVGRREQWLMDLPWADQFQNDRPQQAADAPAFVPEPSQQPSN